ncbi:MAG: helix-turn-helix domain-containing protein [Solirubrobacterales bacterium]
MSGLGQEDKWVLKEWTVAERFSANLVWFRHRAGLTQQELADRVGMNRVVLGALEQGRRLPRIDTILKLVAGLEVRNCDLVAWMWWDPACHHRYETPPSSATGQDVMDFDLPAGFRVSPVGYETEDRFKDRLRQRMEDPAHRRVLDALRDDAAPSPPCKSPDESWALAVAEAVRGLREDRGLTRKELAERVATTPAFIEQIEEGRCPHPAPSFMNRLHLGFGIDQSELFAQIELRILENEG